MGAIPKNWPLYRSVSYLGGRGISFGSPILPAQETNPSVYSVVVDVIQNGRTSVMDKDLGVFADESLDHVYIGPRLEVVEDQEKFLRTAARKLKLGKHLVVHTNIRYSQEPGTFPLIPRQVREMVGKVGRWQEKDSYEHDGVSLQIYKRIKGTTGILPQKPRSDRPRVAVCRFGALGDAIILSPLLREYFSNGWDVTFVGTPYCWPALQGNPYINNVLLQERDAIPNQELGQYWDLWKQDYDRYINLSESLEGDLLIVEGRKEFFTTKSWRHARCNRNYYDYTMARGGFPEVTGRNGELYFTDFEERRAREFFDPLKGKFVIVWALNGSSHHKVYPLMEAVLRKFLDTHLQAVAVTVGDDLARLLEFPHPQVLERSGKWSIRESLISTKYASVVVGPETMVTNASGCFPTPKIVLLSHSSKENLTKYWENDYSLEPDQSLAPCYPCHMLHYSKASCPVGTVEDTETGEEIGQAPICSVAILPQLVLERLEEIYQKHYLKVI